MWKSFKIAIDSTSMQSIFCLSQTFSSSFHGRAGGGVREVGERGGCGGGGGGGWCGEVLYENMMTG